jgi:hypothetical protein
MSTPPAPPAAGRATALVMRGMAVSPSISAAAASMPRGTSAVLLVGAAAFVLAAAAIATPGVQLLG